MARKSLEKNKERSTNFVDQPSPELDSRLAGFAGLKNGKLSTSFHAALDKWNRAGLG